MKTTEQIDNDIVFVRKQILQAQNNHQLTERLRNKFHKEVEHLESMRMIAASGLSETSLQEQKTALQANISKIEKTLEEIINPEKKTAYKNAVGLSELKNQLKNLNYILE